MNDLAFFKSMAKNDLLSFCSYTDKFFSIVEIHKKMAKALTDIKDGKVKRLILELPPRSWKSRITSEFVAWYLWHHPEKDIILTGHGSSLLEWFSRNIRDRINSKEYMDIFNTKLSDGNTAVKSWKTSEGGEFSIFWVGWGITGKWGHLLIIDDPYATREDAESETIKTKTWDWYKSTFLSRRQNEDSAIVVIMQRWAEDDLVGRLLEESSDDWTRISIPAIDWEGKSFWPEKFSVGYLEEMRKEIGEYFFMSQYQQDPVNEWSWAFLRDYFQYSWNIEGTEIARRLDIVTFLDPAISKKQEADSSAIVTIWLDPVTNLIYVLEVKKLKEEPDKIIDEVFHTVHKYSVMWNSFKFGIEVVQFQKMLALEIQKQMRVRNKFFILEEVRPTGEKEARIRSMLQPRYSNRSIIHNKNVFNTNELESELLKFPNGKHDDLIDALSSGMTLIEASNLGDVWEEVITFDYSSEL